MAITPEPNFEGYHIRKWYTFIEDTLASFGVPAKVVEVNQGPTVTQFGVEPGYIERAVDAAKEECEELQTLGDIADYEIIIVNDASTDRKCIESGWNCTLEHGELVVDFDPQCLEGALGRVATRATCRSRDCVAYNGNETFTARKWFTRTLANDGRSNAMCESLFTVLAKNASQLTLVVGIDHLGSSDAR